MNIRRSRRARGSNERGAVLILTAFALVAVTIIASLVVDLGRVKSTRRDAQNATDLAGIAAGFYLSGRGNTTVTSDPRAACRAALNSIRTNVESLPAATALDCNALPATAISPGCTSTTSPVTVDATDAAPFVLSVQYPVPASAIVESRYATGVGTSDGSSQCERMKITLSRTLDGAFTGILGNPRMVAGAKTVVRSSLSRTGSGVAALLLLERVGCATLQTSGGGSQGAGVVVQSAGTTPAVIQSDSAGVVGASAPTTCTTNENASGYTIYGTALPAAGGGGPSITAQATASGNAGVIGVRALAVAGRGGAVAVTGISPAATEASVMSRAPADAKYNKPVASGGTAQIEALHTAAYGRATMSSSTALAAGYRVLNGAACSGLDTATTPVVEQLVFVDCPSGFSASSAIFPNATAMIFTGKVSVPNNSVLSLPVVQRVDIRGCLSNCSGGGNYALSVAGTLRVNTGGNGTTSPSCSTRSGPGAGGTTTNWTQLATFSGPIVVTGTVSLCQTFLYLGENSPTYVRRTQTATGTSPENYPAIAGCSTALPCPSNSGGPATISVSGGAGTADWTAPNQLSIQPTASSFAANPYEDLALWTESSVDSFIKGQGASRTEGVFFAPNSAMTFTGQATQSQPLNAQFISRTLNVSGQGTLNLKPNPADSLVTPLAGTSILIR